MTGDTDGAATAPEEPPADLDDFERRLLAKLVAGGDLPPAGLAVALDADLPAVLDAVADLRNRGLLDRHGFTTCRATDRGRELVGETSGPRD